MYVIKKHNETLNQIPTLYRVVFMKYNKTQSDFNIVFVCVCVYMLPEIELRTSHMQGNPELHPGFSPPYLLEERIVFIKYT